jgi:hypothetical protein
MTPNVARAYVVAAVGVVAGLLLIVLLTGSLTHPIVTAQPVRPPECVCSTGTLLSGQMSIINCQCGQLSCAVTLPSGRLQCTK